MSKKISPTKTTKKHTVNKSMDFVSEPKLNSTLSVPLKGTVRKERVSMIKE